MLHGVRITDSKPLKTTKIFEQASGEFATFHVSAAVLDKCPDPKAKVRLVVKLEEKFKNQEVTLATLSKDRDMVKLSLYMNCTQQTQLLLKAPKETEVSLSGYFEPKGDDMDDDMFYGQEDADEDDLEDESGSDDEEEVTAKANGSKK